MAFSFFFFISIFGNQFFLLVGTLRLFYPVPFTLYPSTPNVLHETYKKIRTSNALHETYKKVRTQYLVPCTPNSVPYTPNPVPFRNQFFLKSRVLVQSKQQQGGYLVPFTPKGYQLTPKLVTKGYQIHPVPITRSR